MKNVMFLGELTQYLVHNYRPVIMLKHCLLIIFTVIYGTHYAQKAPDFSFDVNKKFSIAQLKQDIMVLKDSLEMLHPALYRYTPKQSFDSLFQAAYMRINKPMALSEFYGIVTPLIGSVGDIHSSIEMPDEYHSFLATKSILFPFDVRIIDKDVFIASNNSTDSSIQVGSRIIKINNKPIAAVLEKMKRYFSSEGINESFKLRTVEQRFAFLYHTVYGYCKQFKLEYVERGKKSKLKTITALPFSTIKVNRDKNKQMFPHLKALFPQPPYLTLTLDKGKQTGILTIKWFQNDVLQESGEQFKPFVDSAFTQIKRANIRNLIIDIRNNGGGESGNASYLYSYVTDKPFRFIYCIETSLKTYKDDSKLGVRYVFNKTSGKYRTSDSTAKFPQLFGLSKQQPQINNFIGSLYVLIDGMTTSAATQFAALVKLNNRGKLVGEEAPGALSGGSGRGYSAFFLPNSGLLTIFSHYRLYMTDPNIKSMDKTVSPDYKTTVSISDLLNGNDKALQYLLNLVNTTK
jgi:C-terminal processing protease CtpA/Prc